MRHPIPASNAGADCLSLKVNHTGALPATGCGSRYFPNRSYPKLYLSSSQKKQKNQLAFEASERERISAELSFLKAQINPHFFFKKLHTIYALMDNDQPAAKTSI